MSNDAHSRAMRDPGYAADLRRATLASSVGSALEYYDFALYGLASALIFAQLFFAGLDPAVGLVASFAVYGVGFLARPLGGLFFGTVGDRLGRKWVLLITIALMGGASTLIGALPTYDQVGIWAPILLVVLRLLQGFGAGAEQAGASVLMAEYAPVRRRGFYAALPFVGIQAGTLLAAIVFTYLGTLPENVLLSGVWRIPFLASILLIGVAVFIRLRLRESPTFVELEAQEQVAGNPLREVIGRSFPDVLRGIGLRMAENGGSYLFNTLAVSFAVGTIGVDPSIGPLAVAVASVVGIVSVPLAGHLSDRFGRLPVYRFGAAVLLLLAFPGWWALSLGNAAVVIVVIAVAIGVGVNSMLGAQCALLPEMFGNRHRYIGVATAREFSAVLAGGIAPTLGAFLIATSGGSWLPIAIYVAVLAVITLATTVVTPETRGRDLTLLEDASRDTEEQVLTRPTPIVSRREFAARARR
ncbi:MFS transporter [Rathayibacter rathayi]|nr:MFS transporter [Rathayibacter rathayi]TWD68873.1 MHS family metabolite:H+ symporter-like MFS transporter [Rathayibacter rathayi]SOE05599.1 MFS transporter, MHS family, metabolite:H+ symporter [Rathayibacter rathayi NCPPB 2980 = VKM Ac-1601]